MAIESQVNACDRVIEETCNKVLLWGWFFASRNNKGMVYI